MFSVFRETDDRRWCFVVTAAGSVHCSVYYSGTKLCFLQCAYNLTCSNSLSSSSSQEKIRSRIERRNRTTDQLGLRMTSCELSKEVLEYWKNNETNEGPSFLQTAECPPPEWIPLLIIAIALWVATVAVTYVSTSRFSSYRWTKPFIYTMSRRVLFYYVGYSLLNVLVILNAKGGFAYSYINDVIEALCFLSFYMLIWSYSGGMERTLKKLIGLEFNLGQPPLCCLRCAPNIKINERFIWWMEKLLLQLPLVQFVAGLINATLVSAGIPAALFKHWTTTTLYIIMTISFMLSMYSIGTLYACLSQFIVGRRVGAKFAVFKITIILDKVQTVILTLCASTVDPYGYYSRENRTEMWAAFLVCVECLILSLVASFLYKKSDYDTAHHVVQAEIRYKREEDGVVLEKGLELAMDEVDLGKPSLVIENPTV